MWASPCSLINWWADVSIVEDTPGVTRTVCTPNVNGRGRTFDIVDTGGIEPGTTTEILSFMRKQAEIAIANATVIVFLCDVKTGLTAADQDVANLLLRARKPVILAVNKMDQVGMTNRISMSFKLGLGDPIAVSASHGHGTGDLLDSCCHFPPEEEEEEDPDLIKVAVISKPNAGESSSSAPILGGAGHPPRRGRTPGPVDHYENRGGLLRIDTAGMRHKARWTTPSKISVLRAEMAMERAMSASMLIDGSEGAPEAGQQGGQASPHRE